MVMTPEERQEIRERHAKAVLRRGTKRCIVDDWQWPCDTARLLADYDHLVEVAREAVDAWDASVVNGDVEPAIEDLRALIDPATRQRSIAEKVDALEQIVHPEGRCVECGGGKSYWKHGDGPDQHPFDPATSERPVYDGVDEFFAALDAIDPATPEPVEGEPNE